MNPNGLLALRFFVKTYVITFRFTSSATLMRHLAPYLYLHYTILDFICQEIFHFSFQLSPVRNVEVRGVTLPSVKCITLPRTLDTIAVTIGQVAFACFILHLHYTTNLWGCQEGFFIFFQDFSLPSLMECMPS